MPVRSTKSWFVCECGYSMLESTKMIQLFVHSLRLQPPIVKEAHVCARARESESIITYVKVYCGAFSISECVCCCPSVISMSVARNVPTKVQCSRLIMKRERLVLSSVTRLGDFQRQVCLKKWVSQKEWCLFRLFCKGSIYVKLRSYNLGDFWKHLASL